MTLIQCTIFPDNVGNQVPECQTIPDYPAARDDGSGSYVNQNSKMCNAASDHHQPSTIYSFIWKPGALHVGCALGPLEALALGGKMSPLEGKVLLPSCCPTDRIKPLKAD